MEKPNREDTQKTAWKKWTKMHEEGLWEHRYHHKGFHSKLSTFMKVGMDNDTKVTNHTTVTAGDVEPVHKTSDSDSYSSIFKTPPPNLTLDSFIKAQ
jgi:hypothetical protein